MKYIIKYGTKDHSIDVTQFCLDYLCIDSIICFPVSDVDRGKTLGDPLWGILKSIFIYDVNNNIVEIIPSGVPLYIDCMNNILYKENAPEHVKNVANKFIYPQDKLKAIQDQLTIRHGSFNEEYPEQLMTTMFLKGNEKVLELGANIGRNSLIIGKILQKYGHQNLVSLETNSVSCEKLKENRDINGLSFHIENSALSKRQLIQKDWTTIVSDVVKEGWTPVNTITYNELCKKYDIKFDTLVADCEGALLPILLDMPEVLSNIKLIITENDYKTSKEKACLDYILEFNGFRVVYFQPLGMDCYLELGCVDNFYEVWKRDL